MLMNWLLSHQPVRISPAGCSCFEKYKATCCGCIHMHLSRLGAWWPVRLQLGATSAQHVLQGCDSSHTRIQEFMVHLMAYISELLEAGNDGVHEIDPLRITLVTDGLGMSGFEVDDLLQRSFGVCAEMSTDKVIPTCHSNLLPIPGSAYRAAHDHQFQMLWKYTHKYQEVACLPEGFLPWSWLKYLFGSRLWCLRSGLGRGLRMYISWQQHWRPSGRTAANRDRSTCSCQSPQRH